MLWNNEQRQLAFQSIAGLVATPIVQNDDHFAMVLWSQNESII
jgi:hypothetical protein